MVNSCYRGLPVLELAGRGHAVGFGIEAGRLKPALLRQCDVVHIYRYQDGATRKLARELREAGIGIVWDNDDDLSAEMQGISMSMRGDALQAQQARSGTLRMLELAHVVTTPSAALAEQYREWGAAEVRVVENFLPDSYAPSPPRSHGGVTIGWTACEEHKHDLAALDLRRTLRELLDRHPALRVESVGLDLGLPADRYRRFPLVQYEQLADHVAAFDVGIAPIDDIAFNRARSNVKIKEYAAAGVPWLASPIGPYAGLGERQGGRLVADDAWPRELDRLIRDGRGRRKLAKRGRKWAEGQTLAANLDAWEAVLAEALERARPRP
jgi:glycosyltransferase involved in cell wall biosynthesis